MSFRIRGLSPDKFHHLFGLSDAALRTHGARRWTCTHHPGFPDRIELRDLEVGEAAILVNYVHQPADGPYRSSHAVFVREGATVPYDRVGEVPDVMRIRPISLRAFDESGEMVGAELGDGAALAEAIARQFERPDAAYLHAHYAVRGCFAARIDRA